MIILIPKRLHILSIKIRNSHNYEFMKIFLRNTIVYVLLNKINNTIITDN